VIYSSQRSGNFDLYARNARSDGTMSAEIRLTSDPGTDLFPVAATDSTGRVWVAWQGFRNDNLEILASVENGDTFWPETIVSTSPASDWDPAIATAPDGVACAAARRRRSTAAAEEPAPASSLWRCPAGQSAPSSPAP